MKKPTVFFRTFHQFCCRQASVQSDTVKYVLGQLAYITQCPKLNLTIKIPAVPKIERAVRLLERGIDFADLTIWIAHNYYKDMAHLWKEIGDKRFWTDMYE